MSPALSRSGGSTEAASQGEGDLTRGLPIMGEATDEAVVEASGDDAFGKARNIIQSPLGPYTAAPHARAGGDPDRIRCTSDVAGGDGDLKR